MDLGAPELELIDPTPNVHNLFIQFDRLFFCAKLASRAIVRWSKKMYSCAGVCSYEGRGGLCDIALSEPLLKLRPRRNLVETLLHEMIHAYLFITCRDNDRDGHGPNFKAHMYRINKIAGINITIYHDFHDEVKLYQTHVWRCNGPCQQRRPHFGIVRQTINKAPGPKDYWWETHRRFCGGTFVKIEEPSKPGKKNNKNPPTKPKADITKYINTAKTVNNIPQNIPTKPVLKDSNKTKSNGGNTLVISKKQPVYNPQVVTNKSPTLFAGKGQTLANVQPRSNSMGVVETVRNIWANKQIPANPTVVTSNKQVSKPNMFLNNTVNTSNKTGKHKIESQNTSPPAKLQRIDKYFKATASSVLKDIYGKDFQIRQANDGQKVIAVASTNSPLNTNFVGSETKASEIKPSLTNKPRVTTEPKPLGNNAVDSTSLVDCPICKAKINNNDINRHLDECLNKEVIETLCKDNNIVTQSIPPTVSSQSSVKEEIKKGVGNIPAIRPGPEISDNIRNKTFSTISNSVVYPPMNDSNHIDSIKKELNTAVIVLEDDKKDAFDPKDVKKVNAIVKKINYEKIVQETDKSSSPTEEKTTDFGYLPSFLDDIACKIENPKIKIEPGTSKDIVSQVGHKCACCGMKMDKPIEEHLDECLAFFDNNNTIPNEGTSTSFANETIIIDDDDDDIFDESQIFNATGTKTPCPCCLKMIEEAEMKEHLDHCLSEMFEE